MEQQSILSRYLRPETLSQIAGLKFSPRGLVEGNLSGAHQSRRHGFAIEFAGHREYAPGDDIRHIDWNVFYRRDKYFIKQYVMETNLVAHLWLDVSASMSYGEGDQNKLTYATRMLSTMGHLALKQSDKVSFAAFDTEVRGRLGASNAMDQVIRMAEIMNGIEANEKTEAERALSELTQAAGRRGVVMLFSDFFMDLEQLKRVAQRLRAANHEIVLFHVMHPDELYFKLDGMVRFEGLESAEAFLSRPEDVRGHYLKALEAYQGQLDSLCDSYQMERVLCCTDREMGAVLADYLLRRETRSRRV